MLERTDDAFCFADRASLNAHYRAVRHRLTTPRVVLAPARPMAGRPPAPAETMPVDLVFFAVSVSDSNRAAVLAAQCLAEGRLPGNLLYLHGPAGSGKTRLVEAIRRCMGRKVRVIDNADTGSTARIFGAVQGGGPAVIAGRDGLGVLPVETAEALGRAVVVELAEPDAALRRAVALREFGNVPPPADLLAGVVAAGLDLHRQAGLIRSLRLAAHVSRTAVSLDLMRPMLDAMLQARRETPMVRIADVMRAVAQHYRVSRDDLLSQRRTAHVVMPRQVAMYLAKRLTLRSLPEIGRQFGGRDHTTVLHAVRKMEAMAATDAALAAEMDALAEMVARGAGAGR